MEQDAIRDPVTEKITRDSDWLVRARYDPALDESQFPGEETLNQEKRLSEHLIRLLQE